MTREIERVRKRLQRLEERAQEGNGFVGNIMFVANRLKEEDEHEETNISVSTGPNLSFVDIRIEAWFASLDGVPMSVVDTRDWGTCSVSQADGKVRVYLKERKDLRV